MIPKIIRRVIEGPPSIDERDVLRELNNPQWIDHAAWTVARDLGCSKRRALEALRSVASKGYAQQISFKEDGYLYESFMITKRGLAAIGEAPQANPAALPGNEFVHILGDRRLHPENYPPVASTH